MIREGLRVHNMITTYRLFFWICLTVLSGLAPLQAQDPDTAIHQLKEGILIVRLPSFKNKIDTLQNLLAKTAEGPQKKRLAILLSEAIEERDSTRADYMGAFRDHYNFSKVAFVMDHDFRDPERAAYFGTDGASLSTGSFRNVPIYYLFFERTDESGIDALVIYDREHRRIPPPFPNNFIQGGLGFLFISLEGKSFANWRVKKLNKKLRKFYKYARI